MKINTTDDLVMHLFTDLLSAEKQIIEKLPDVVKKVEAIELKTALTEHLGKTKEHIVRLRQAARKLDIEIKDTTCKGMEGILKENEEALKNTENTNLIDIVIIGGARKVEHYEMAGYMNLILLLENYKDVTELLQQNLDEEMEADKKLSSLVL